MAGGPWLMLTQAKTDQPVLVNVGHVQAFKRHPKAGTEVCWVYGEGGLICVEETPEQILAKLSVQPPPTLRPDTVPPRPTRDGTWWQP